MQRMHCEHARWFNLYSPSHQAGQLRLEVR